MEEKRLISILEGAHITTRQVDFRKRYPDVGEVMAIVDYELKEGGLPELEGMGVKKIGDYVGLLNLGDSGAVNLYTRLVEKVREGWNK